MAIYKDSDSIFIPFKNGESLLTDRGEPRLYKSKENYIKYNGLREDIELVEYTPIKSNERDEFIKAVASSPVKDIDFSKECKIALTKEEAEATCTTFLYTPKYNECIWEYGTSCLSCGESVPCYPGEGQKICDSCKSAIAFIKNRFAEELK